MTGPVDFVGASCRAADHFANSFSAQDVCATNEGRKRGCVGEGNPDGVIGTVIYRMMIAARTDERFGYGRREESLNNSGGAI